MSDFTHLDDTRLLALLIYGEAEGEPVEGKVGVAHVVKNRRADPGGRWPTEWHGVILQPKQFSCFNLDAPRRRLLEGIAGDWTAHLTDGALAESLWVADGVIHGRTRDNTGGANHYLTKRLFSSPEAPAWSRTAQVTARLGAHVFLKK